MSSNPQATASIRFQLRTIFVAITLFACAIAWVGYHLDWIRQRHAVLAKHERMYPLQCFIVEPEEDPAPWPLNWFGEPSASNVGMVLREPMPANEVARIQKLFPETKVTVWGSPER